MLPVGEGSTLGRSHSERYLAEVCEKSFLSLWSHPNLFKKLNQELCDLLVSFGDDIIVFSDKSCTFQPGPHGWSRWYRRSILESAHQLQRAASWLRKHPSEVFLDARCSQRFPFTLPQSPRIHLVAVAVGAGEACRAHFNGGLGSLSIVPDADGRTPFEVGDLDSHKEFVHILDEVTLDIVLRELDTIADFVEYLRAKVLFLRSDSVGYVSGEENLVAHYFINSRSLPVSARRDGKKVLLDGDWDYIRNSAPYVAHRSENHISYLWDEIINSIASALVTGEVEPSCDMNLESGERCLRLLARESRLNRRALAFSLSRFMQQARELKVGYNTCRLIERPAEVYVFVMCARWDGVDELEYRKVRQLALQARCTYVKGESPQLSRIVGLAFASLNDMDSTIDFIVNTYEHAWTSDEIGNAMQLKEIMGWKSMGQLPVLRDGFTDFPMSATHRNVIKTKNDAAKRKLKRKATRTARKQQRR